MSGSEQDKEFDRHSPLWLTHSQRSHVLFILSNAEASRRSAFLEWYQGKYRDLMRNTLGVLSLEHYEQDPIDITMGNFARLPFHYLGVCEISVDGAQAASGVIDLVTRLHREEESAQDPATWLYYPACEKVGRSARSHPSMLTLAFANGTRGQESEFREWYATRHVRHAMHVPALVSGQCFERTLFQLPGAMEPGFSTIAMYEQEGTPQSMIDSFATLPESTFHFPMLDLSRFAESVYRPV